MNSTLQILFICGIVVFLGAIIYFLRNNSLSLKYVLLWFLSALIMLIVSIVPGLLVLIADILGFELASNALFSLLIGFTITILFSVTVIISKQSAKIKSLVQTCALLEKRVRELERKKDENDPSVSD
jgi:hypothetical protein